MAELNLKNHSAVIIRPRITEKASIMAAQNIYTFEVAKSATKPQVARAIKEIYNVMPTKVNIVPIPSKHVFSRGKAGVKSGSRKAYVELKEGDKIEFV
jgi:large subunit ribosomal protein L23